MDDEPKKLQTAIISRTMAAAAAAGFDLIKAGCKVQILGKDFAKDMKEIIDEALGVKRFTTPLTIFRPALDQWMKDVMDRCVDPDTKEIKDDKVEYLTEQEEFYGCLVSIIERLDQNGTVQDVIDNINAYFVDSESLDPEAYVCCTGHRSKGLEFPRVIVLRMDLCPHPRAESAEELLQEANLKYVMLTRAIDEMYICADGEPK